MAKRSNEPILWVLFSAGGVVAAFLIPVLLFLLFLAFPLGWIEAPSYNGLLGLVRLPITRLVLFVLCFLSLFHWAHRFRYTLYDGLLRRGPCGINPGGIHSLEYRVNGVRSAHPGARQA